MLIVKVTNNDIEYRSYYKGDFWKLSGKCFGYDHSMLTRTSKNDDWKY